MSKAMTDESHEGDTEHNAGARDSNGNGEAGWLLSSKGAKPGVNEPDPIAFNPSSFIPFDKLGTKGTLKNGMAYYVRANRHPQERAELRIAIKVGSVMEADEERGVAHMIEHLAFRASRTCPQEFNLVKELESHGIKFGAHQNAYTSFEETVYELHVPADSPGLLERSLRVLRQLALEVRLSDEDVERERSIVVEEWRQGRGCAQRATEEFFKLVVKGSLFEERLPIGMMEVIKSVTPETVRAFYARHYHPERMAVIAVGDFENDGAGVVELIRDVFEGCPRGNSKVPPPVEVPSHYDVRAAVFSDSEATSSSLVLEVKQAAQPMVTHGDYRREVTEDLFHACLNARLSKTAMRDHPPFLTASSSTPLTVAALSSMQLTVTSLDGGLPGAMRAALTEVHRIKIHGFSDREVCNAKRNHLAEVKGEWVARDQTDSNTLCSDYLEHFLRKNPAPGICWEAGAIAPLLEVISTEDVNHVADRYSWGRNTVIFATCPAPGRLALLQSWVWESLPSMLRIPLGEKQRVVSKLTRSWSSTSSSGSGLGSGSGSGSGNESDVADGGFPTREELLAVIRRFEERGNDSGDDTGSDGDGGERRGRKGSWERVREWSYERWGEPLEIEDLLPEYLLVGTAGPSASSQSQAAEAVDPGDGGDEGTPDEVVRSVSGDEDAQAVEAKGRASSEGEGIGIKELVLENGMKVGYKCTGFCDDEVLFSGIAHGGRTELPQDKAPSALMAVTVAEELGIFGVKPSKAMDMLTGKRVNLGLSIETYDREVSGSCAAADLEAALQLLHLVFVAELRWDEGRLETVLSYVAEHVANQSKDPQEKLIALINHVNTQGHPFHATPSLKLLSEVDPRWAAAYFKSQFRNPAAFQFLFVGTMDPSTAVPLFHKYLGRIPRPSPANAQGETNGNGRGAKHGKTRLVGQGEEKAEELSIVRPWEEPTRERCNVTPLDVRFPPTKVTRSVRVPMADPHAVSTITFPVALGGSRHPTHSARLRDNILIQFAAVVLETRLNEVLRFSLGRTYAVSVQESFSSAPPMVSPDQPLPGTVMITLSCEPRELPLLQATTISELKKLQEEGPKPEEIRSAVETDRRDRETAERTNSYWLHSLSMQYISPRYDGDVTKAYEELVRCRKDVQASLSPEMLKEAYVHFFGDLQRRTEVSLMPQRRWRSAGRLAAVGLVAAGVVTLGAVAVSRSRRR